MREKERQSERETSIGCLLHVPRPGITTTSVCGRDRGWNLQPFSYRMMLQPAQEQRPGKSDFSLSDLLHSA